MKQETQTSSAVFQWVMQLVRENPAIFGNGGGWKVSVLREPQVSSHNTRIYQVDHTKVHVKFFERTLGRTNITYDPVREMEAEYTALKEFEKRGFSSGRYQVVRALGANEARHCALATIYAGGTSLQTIIREAVAGTRDESDLYMGLELAAGLLRKIHTVMPQSFRLDGAELFYAYLKSLIYLEEQDALGGYHRRVMRGLTNWYNYKPMFEQRGVTVHGDANPSNFKIDGGIIYAFDAERSRPRRSPGIDLGTLAAELTHQFAHETGDGAGARPYIDHFLQAYSVDHQGRPDERELQRIRAILPFFMSQSFFKIAMLGFWKPDYKRYLIEQGARCIEVKPP
jgi:hypothetical protein